MKLAKLTIHFLVWAAVAATAMTRQAGDGTFEDPLVRSRPRFRYWIPDASVDADAVLQRSGEPQGRGGSWSRRGRGFSFLRQRWEGKSYACRSRLVNVRFWDSYISRHIQSALKAHANNGLVLVGRRYICAAARPLTRPANYSAGGDPCGSRDRFAADAPA